MSLTSCSLSDYVVLSEFTIAALEDSGWYKANYTALYEIDQPPLQWGKGELFISNLATIACLFTILLLHTPPNCRFGMFILNSTMY